ncbi:uncharacterized protein [Ptychodera flava]|uniref:uncharacterized protein n=1 Tax=Ptychodera flava TaxID=63121 RepID=UPI00396A07A3
MLCKIASDLGYPGPEKLYISTRRSRYHHQCGEDSATKMTVKRHWWFVKEDGQEEVFVYVTDPKKSGASGKIGHRLSIGGRSAKQPTSAVEKLDVDAKNRNGLGQVGIKIHFKNHRHTLYRQEFEWHRNDFCRNFRDITVAADFVTKYNELVSSASDHTEEQTDIIPPDVSMDTDSSLSDSESPLSSPSSSQSCSTSSTSGSSTERRSLSPEPINNSNNICTGNGDKQNKNKRPRSGDSIPDLMKKKRKRVPANEVEADNSMQQLVEGRAIPGIFSIHMCNLKLGKQVREVDSYFVTKLVNSMERFTDDSYSPYIVLVDLRKEQFNKNNVNGYEYTILGGQHNFTATKQMSEKYKDKPLFKSRNCKIYCDLSEEAAMWLSNRHNDIQHLVHKISTREKVQLCRDRLSSENTASEEWRKSCKNILQQNGKDIETILNLAKLQPDIASTLDDVFEAYETGTLKGQKLNKKTMMTKPDLPVYLFHNLVLLNDDTISDFLQNIRDGEMTLQEMNREAKEVKKLKTIQESMVKELHMPWQMFSEKLPEYASREYLSRFKELSFSRGIPPEMVNECRKIRGILDAGENVQDSNHTNIFSGQDGTKGCCIFNRKGDKSLLSRIYRGRTHSN